MSDTNVFNSRIKSLHGLRGLMAWWVVLGHLSLSFGWNLSIFDRNTLAVDVFIIMSGFVISLLIVAKAESYRLYITRRALRLFPLYLVALTFAVLTLSMQDAAWNYLPATQSNANRLVLVADAQAGLWRHVLYHVPLLQGVVPLSVEPRAAYTILGQAWSISLEWQFYLVAPFLVLGLLSAGRLPLVISGGVAFVALAVYFSGAFLGAHIHHFLIGITSFILVSGTSKSRACLAILTLCIVAALAIDKYQAIPIVIWLVVMFAVSRPASRLAVPVNVVLASRLARHMGDLSYSIYINHMFPLYISAALLSSIGAGRSAATLLVTFATVVGTYVAARFTFRWIEQPGIKLGQSLRSMPVPVTTGSVR